MKLLDVNVLLYALDATAPRHHEAKRWLDETLSSAETVLLAWVVILAFLRLSTRRVVFADPLTAEEALQIVEGWLAQPNVSLATPGDRHLSLLRELLADTGTAGNLTTDAHLATLAIEHGAELCSSDADFSRFPGLKWVDPLRG